MIRAPLSYTMASFWKIPIKKTFGHRMECPVLRVQLGTKVSQIQEDQLGDSNRQGGIEMS